MIKGNYLDKKILAPFAAIYGIGLAPLLILPFIFTSMMSEFGVGESQAGSLITYYITAMCLSSLAIAPVIGKAPRRTLALVGTLLAIAGCIWVMFAGSYGQSIPAFIISGLGCGLALSCGNAVVASHKDPDASTNKIVMLGPVILLLAGKYLSRGMLLVLGVLSSGVITYLVTQTDSYPVYTVIVILWSTAHFFTYSCMMGLASIADKKGRIAAAAGSAVMAGTAAAPALAGYAFDLGGYGTLGTFVAVAVALTLVFGLYAIYAVRKSESELQAPVVPQAQ